MKPITKNEIDALRILNDDDWTDRDSLEAQLKAGDAYYLIGQLKKRGFLSCRRVWNDEEETRCNRWGIAYPKNSSTRYYKTNHRGKASLEEISKRDKK